MEHSLNNESESCDFEEEEILVYVQFDGVLEEQLLCSKNKFKIIGLGSEEPILQLGNQNNGLLYCGSSSLLSDTLKVYKGDWKDMVGTAVFFEENKNPPRYDPVFSQVPATTLQYSCQTRKVLQMTRVFANKKKECKQTEESVNNTLIIDDCHEKTVEDILEAKTDQSVELSKIIEGTMDGAQAPLI